MKIILKLFFITTILVICTSSINYADNVMEIVSTETGSDQDVIIQVKITNSDEFIAFQFDIPVPDAFSFVAGSAGLNPKRIDDHVLQETLLPDGTIRIFSYSTTNTAFLGDTGVIVSFQLHSGFDPGDYLLELQDPIIGDTNSTNILTSYINGTVTILCPDINPIPSSSDFGATPLLDSTDRQFTIYNLGNQTLSIQNISFDSPYFSIIGSSSFIIPGGQNNNITVRFHSILKGNYQQIMTISSDDPDESIVTIPLSAIAFPVNEIHTGNIFAYSGDQATLDFSINNMEPFVGFQFDLLMPSVLTYVANSAELSSRKTNHTVSANVISANVLRVVAFSNDNQVFSGDDGNILSLDFAIMGQGGFYNLNLDNTIIGDTAGFNAISAHYNGQLEIAAADIHSVTSLDLGDVSVLDTGQVNLTVYNYGTDTLEITSLSFTNNSFFSTVSLPIYVNPGDNMEIPVSFSHGTKGIAQGEMKIFSNDPDESPYIIDLSAYSFAPNYLIVEDAVANYYGNILISVNAENYENFVGFQFDLEFPDILTFIEGSCSLGRAQDHTIQSTLIDSTHIRVFAYSLLQRNFIGDSGTIVTMGFEVNTDHADDYPVVLQNAILGNQYSENILYGCVDGELNILDPEYEHVINIPNGWSGISSYIAPVDSSIVNIFAPSVSDLIILMHITKIYWPDQGVNTIGFWDPYAGYKIKTANNIQLILTGAVVENNSVVLSVGWNLLPVLSMFNISPSELLSGLGDTLTIVKEIAGVGIYWPGQGINTLEYLETGKSYMIHTNYPCSINYPDSLPSRSYNLKSTAFSSNNNLFDISATPESHVIALGENVMQQLENGDLLCCFTQSGVCAGQVEIKDRTENAALMIFADDQLTVEQIEGFIENELMNFKIYRPNTEEVFLFIPHFNNSLPDYDGAFHTNGLSRIDRGILVELSNTSDTFKDVYLFPNPTKDFINISFENVIENSLFIEIYSLQGELLFTDEVINMQNLKLDFKNYTNGLYFIRLHNDIMNITRKIILLKPY